MLTRLSVSGFKNLGRVDARFGPFTCIAGPNGVGKSNVFDAIAFLSALADTSLAEAAASVRGAEGHVGDVRSLFTQTRKGEGAEMHLGAEMIIPSEGVDDLGSSATASMTYLRYDIVLRRRVEASEHGPFELVSEQLTHINKTGAGTSLGFPTTPVWRDSVIRGRRTVPYIETETEAGRRIVLTRADTAGGKGGAIRGARSRRPCPAPSSPPRTMRPSTAPWS